MTKFKHTDFTGSLRVQEGVRNKVQAILDQAEGASSVFEHPNGPDPDVGGYAHQIRPGIGNEDHPEYMLDTAKRHIEGEISQSANHEVQSAKADEELPPKCKNCTLEEVALLRIVQKNLSATCRKFRQVRQEGSRMVEKELLTYNTNLQ